MIEDRVDDLFVLEKIDPNGITAFQDKQGVIKTSNIPIDDLVVIDKSGINDAIAVYIDGKF